MATADQEIINTLRVDPEQGFRLLMSKYKVAIYWHIRRLVVSHADAQDATQETFVRVFRSFDRVRGDSSFTAWIYRIATNEAIRLLDRRKKEVCRLDDAPEDAGLAKADSYVDYGDLEAVRLQQAIRSLSTKQQVAFNLRYYDELGYEQIAQITDSTPANVKANYHLAKDKIVAYMNSHD